MRNLSCLLFLLIAFLHSSAQQNKPAVEPGSIVAGITGKTGTLSKKLSEGTVTVFLPDTAIKDIKQATLANVSKIDAVNRKIDKKLNTVTGKTDSVLQQIQQVPSKFVKQVNKKVQTYSDRLTGKTEKTLTRLGRWESKIHGLLMKASPETAERLFGNNQQTFASLLQKLKEGKNIMADYTAKYDSYRENLSSGIKYIGEKKQDISAAKGKLFENTSQNFEQLDTAVATSEVVEKFIKDRKNQLIDESIKYIGKSKYLQRMNKEAYYYVETLRNYKELFSDPKKAEELATKILSNIPEFQQFASQHSSLAGLVTPTGSFPSLPAGASSPIVNGIATRSALQSYVQANVPALAEGNLINKVQNKLTTMPAELDKLKNTVNDMGKTKNNVLPEFKPNKQKSKPFIKRLEYGFDLQFGKSINYLPATADIAIKGGYKLNDKSSIGIGISYKMGMGKGWDKLSFTSEAVGYRTYIKWILKKQFAIQGGSEWNYMMRFNKIAELKDKKNWQQSALLGLSKSYNINRKVKGNVQVLYDFLANKHVPTTQPIVIRFGYGK